MAVAQTNSKKEKRRKTPMPLPRESNADAIVEYVPLLDIKSSASDFVSAISRMRSLMFS